MNSAVQGSGADKLKAAMVALQGRLGGGASLPRGACRLVHSVSAVSQPVMSPLCLCPCPVCSKHCPVGQLFRAAVWLWFWMSREGRL